MLKMCEKRARHFCESARNGFFFYIVVVSISILFLMPTLLSAQGWSVELTVNGSGTVLTRTFGGDPKGTDGIDSGLDYPAPPDPPTGTFNSYFLISHPVFPKLTKDVRAWASPYKTEIAWTLKITNASGISTHINWDPAALPVQGVFILAGTIDMRAQSSADFQGDQTLTIAYQCQPNWNVNASDYEYSMALTGVIEFDGVELLDPNDIIGAFVGEECRGVASPTLFPISGRYTFGLTIYSNSASGETITFRAYDASALKVYYTITESYLFQINGIVGNDMNPEVLHAVGPPSTQQYTLNLSIDPLGGGSTIPGAGAHTYDAGTTVDILAEPFTGYVFDRWSGSAEGSMNPLILTMDGDKGITAHFKKIVQVTITTNPNGRNFLVDGISYTAPRTFLWSPGEAHMLSTNSPQSGGEGVRYVFASWSDGGQQTHSYAVPESDQTVTASYKTQYRLTIQSEYGNPTGEDWYDAGDDATFGVLSQQSGGESIRHLFLRWEGSGSGSYSGTDTSYIVTMNNPITEVASWKTQYYLSTSENPVDGGDITPAPPGGWYDRSAVVQMSASAASQYQFAGWSGDLSGTTNPTLITMSGPKRVTANFGKEARVTVGTDPEGLVFTVDATNYDRFHTFTWIENSSHTLSVDSIQENGSGMRYRLDSWTDGGLKIHIHTVSGSLDTIIAHFQLQHKLTIVSLHGEPEGDGWYDEGATAEFAVRSVDVQGSTRYLFKGWSGDHTGADSLGSIVMNNPKNIAANWNTEHRLTVTSLYGNPQGEGWYVQGATASFSVTPQDLREKSRSIFSHWTGDYTGLEPSGSVIMEAPKEVTANWLTQHYLTVTTSHDVASGSGWYDEGSNATFWISASMISQGGGSRYVFNSWSGSGNGSYTGADISHTVTMTNPIDEVAGWKLQYRLTVNSEHGSPIGAGWYDEGSKAMFRVTTPESGGEGIQYVLTQWMGEGEGSYNGSDDSVAITINNPIAETASWKTQYYLSVHSDYGAPEGEGWYDAGTSAAFRVHGMEMDGDRVRTIFTGWTGSGSGFYSGSDTSHTVIMNGPISQVSSWKTQYYLRTAENPDAGGDMIPAPLGGWFDDGFSVDVHSTIHEGYMWGGWSGDLWGDTNPTTIRMDSPKEVTANYLKEVQVTVSTVPLGLNFTVDGIEYDSLHTFKWLENSVHVFSVESAQNDGMGIRQLFSDWSDGGAIIHDYSVPHHDESVIAHFKTQYRLSVNSLHGNSSGDGWYDSGADAIFGISSRVVDGSDGELFVFRRWAGVANGAYTGSDSASEVVMLNPITETALWDTLYSLRATVHPDTGGTLLRIPDKDWYVKEDTVLLIASARSDSSFRFEGWSGDVHSTQDTLALVMDRAYTVRANFKPTTHRLATEVRPSANRGRIEVLPNAVEFLHKTRVTVSAYPNSGYTFDHWEGAVWGISSIAQFDIVTDTVVIGVFGTVDKIPPYLTENYPFFNGKMVPINTSIEFKVLDELSGIDLSTLQLSVLGQVIVEGGSGQTGGAVEIRSIAHGYHVRFSPAVPFDTCQTVTVHVKCQDSARPPNVYEYGYVFTTGHACIIDMTSVNVSSSGGVVEDSSGVRIVILENALRDTTWIQIGRVENPPTMPDTLNGVGLTYQFGPEGMIFRYSVSITIPIEASDLEDAGVLNMNCLKLFLFSVLSGTWEAFPISDIDTENRTITFRTNHFSVWRLAAWVQPFSKSSFEGFAAVYNYPNPFNPDQTPTVICYQLSDDAAVSMKIYDVAGRLVSIIEENVHRSKFVSYRKEWDGRNSRGEVVANNVYFCVIESKEGRRIIRKIAVLR